MARDDHQKRNGQMLRDARRNKRMTLKDLAGKSAEFGTARSIQTFSAIERGERAATSEIERIYVRACGFEGELATGHVDLDLDRIRSFLDPPIIEPDKGVARRARRPGKPRVIHDPEDAEAPIAHLILGERQASTTSNHENRVIIIDRGIHNWEWGPATSLAGWVDRCIDVATANEVTIDHAVFQSAPPPEIVEFRKFTQRQLEPGDYTFRRLAAGWIPDRRDIIEADLLTIIRPGVGSFTVLAPDRRDVSEFISSFDTAESASPLHQVRLEQMQTVMDSLEGPYRTIDKSGRLGFGIERERVEERLAEIERPRGERICLKNGLSDATLPPRLCPAHLSMYEHPDSPPAARRDALNAIHRRINSFRRHIRETPHIDIVPRATLESYARDGLQVDSDSGARTIITPEQAREHIASVLRRAAEKDNKYQLAVVDESIVDLSATGYTALLAKHDEATDEWTLFYESLRGPRRDTDMPLTVAFETQQPELGATIVHQLRELARQASQHTPLREVRDLVEHIGAKSEDEL